jgi:Family of unknown function (DUF5829)
VNHRARGYNRIMATLTTLAWLAGAIAMAAPEPSPAPSPPVYLNHFFVVVDAESYRALQESAFVRDEWAPFEKRTTVRNDETYTGIYWYGHHTYYELFEPEAEGPVGSSGLALGVEEPGQSRVVKAIWSEALGGAGSGSVTRKTETAEPTWFEITYASVPPGVLRIFLLEYDESFLARWYSELTPARGIARADVLDRYVAKIGRTGDRGKTLLRDVTGLVIALEPAERETLVKHLQPLGWSVSDDDHGTLLGGPEGVSIQVIEPTPGRRGIVEASFSLQHRVRPHSERLGSVVLTVDRDHARLQFAP